MQPFVKQMKNKKTNEKQIRERYVMISITSAKLFLSLAVDELYLLAEDLRAELPLCN